MLRGVDKGIILCKSHLVFVYEIPGQTDLPLRLLGPVPVFIPHRKSPFGHLDHRLEFGIHTHAGHPQLGLSDFALQNLALLGQGLELFRLILNALIGGGISVPDLKKDKEGEGAHNGEVNIFEVFIHDPVRKTRLGEVGIETSTRSAGPVWKR